MPDENLVISLNSETKDLSENLEEDIQTLIRAQETEAPVTNGFYVDKKGFRQYISENHIDKLLTRLHDIKEPEFYNLNRLGEQIRSQIVDGDIPRKLEEELISHLDNLQSSKAFKLKIESHKYLNSVEKQGKGKTELIKKFKEAYSDFLTNQFLGKVIETEKEIIEIMPEMVIIPKWNQDRVFRGEANSTFGNTKSGNTLEIKAPISKGKYSLKQIFLFKDNLKVLNSEEELKEFELTRNQLIKLGKNVYELEKFFESNLKIKWEFNSTKGFRILEIEKISVERLSGFIEYPKDPKEVLEGSSQEFGLIKGKVNIPRSVRDLTVDEDDILVLDHLSLEFLDTISKSKAVVINRESDSEFRDSIDKKILSDAERATSFLDDGEEVVVDFGAGKIVKNPEIYGEKSLTQAPGELDVYLDLEEPGSLISTASVDFDGINLRFEDLKDDNEFGIETNLSLVASLAYPRTIRIYCSNRVSEHLDVINNVGNKGLDNLEIVFEENISLEDLKNIKKEFKVNINFDIPVSNTIDSITDFLHIKQLNNYFDGFILRADNWTDEEGEKHQRTVEKIIKKFKTDILESEKEYDLFLPLSKGLETDKFIESFDSISVKPSSLSEINELNNVFEQDKKRKELEIDLETELRDAATKIQTELEKENKIELKSLEDRLEIDSRVINQCLGWLAKEDKIKSFTDGEKRFYKSGKGFSQI